MIDFRQVEIHDANFIHKLMTVEAYEDIFYEKDTSVLEWENRIQLLKEERAMDNYVIYDSKENKSVGWIMYEVDKETVFLHLIAIDYKKLGKKYAYNSLKKLVEELASKSIKKYY